MRSHHCRHAIRWGVALGVATATYRLVGLNEHGYWVPLTVLFVLRPEQDETLNRILLRALGTAVGLVLATGLAEAFGGDDVVLVIIMCAATTSAYALLAIQYAFFTAAITVFAVVLADSLGEAATEAAKQRGVATAIGLVIAGLAFVLWSNHGTEPIFLDASATADSG